MLNTTVSQPGFHRTSLWVTQEITRYLKILKYHEKYPISLERWPKLCTAIVLYLVISVRYQLPPRFLVCKRFQREGVPQDMEVTSGIFPCKSWETLLYTTSHDPCIRTKQDWLLLRYIMKNTPPISRSHITTHFWDKAAHTC